MITGGHAASEIQVQGTALLVKQPEDAGPALQLTRDRNSATQLPPAATGLYPPVAHTGTCAHSNPTVITPHTVEYKAWELGKPCYCT